MVNPADGEPHREPRSRWLSVAPAALLLGLAAGAAVLAGAHPRWEDPLMIAVVVFTALGTITLQLNGARPAAAPRPDQDLDTLDPPVTQAIPPLVPVEAPTPRLLPVRQESFKGRVAELAELTRRHDLGRIRRQDPRQDPWQPGDDSAEDSATAGALLILLHGRPGVGKSALALEFAHRLAASYPGGQLYANLGSVGNQRPPGDVLKEFLHALGWNRRMPRRTEDRAKSFRSLLADRKQQVLVVLEAARDPDQVRQILPTDPGSTVIVTSRSDLGPALSARAPSLLVDVPPVAEAADILRAAAQTSSLEQPVCTARVVELCARLPLALRSAGEQAAELPGGLCEIAETLQPEHTRLTRLQFRGRNVRRRFEIEYHRLTERERQAFRLLALVSSATFLPRVLVALMEVPPAEAENLIVRLYAAQLVDVAGPDAESGMARYRFHPLVRLYAGELLAATTTEPERAAARDRLAGAEFEAVEALMGRRMVPTPHDDWIADLVDTAQTAAARRAWGTCWRIAALLGDHLPHDVDPERCLRVFDDAQHAAERDGNRLGQVTVAVARGTYIINIEQYDEGIAALTEAARAGTDLSPPLVVRAYRRIGEAHLRLGAYGDATKPLDLAHQFGSAQPDDPVLRTELGLIRILQAEARAATDPASWLDETPYHDVQVDHDDSRIAFRAHLNLAEVARRRRDWQSARQHLAMAEAMPGADADRAASVAYRIARLHLTEARLTGGDEALPSIERAVNRAAETVLMFRRIHHHISAVRAQCLLARALLLGGRLEEAEEQIREANRALHRVRNAATGTAEPIEARIKQAHGELLLSQGRHPTTVDILRRAEQIFATNQDWAGRAESRRLLSRAHLQVGSHQAAIDVLWPAAEDYRTAGEPAWMHDVFVDLAAACAQEVRP